MGNEAAQSELFTRMNSIEQVVASHVSSCTERRLREDDRHKTYDDKLTELIMRQNKTDENVTAIKDALLEQKIKFGAFIGLISAAACFLSNLAVAWLTK